MRIGLTLLTLIFMAGIAFAHFCRMSFLLILSIIAILALTGVKLLKNSLIRKFYLGLLTFLSGALLLTNNETLPACHIANFIYLSVYNPITVKGFIVDEPSEKIGVHTFVFRVEQLQDERQNRNCCGDILVRVHSKETFHYHETLILRGFLKKIYPLPHSSTGSYERYLLNRGILFTLKVDGQANIARLPLTKLSPRRLALRTREMATRLFSQYVSSLTASLLNAMVLGDKRNIPSFVNQIMIRSGTIHILVVSGFNVGVVCFVAILLFKIVRIRRNLRIILTSLVLIFYCLFTGAATPVVRATIMATISLWAYLVKRDADMRNSLSLAALWILINNPRQLFDASFQLSFASVASLVIFYPAVASFLRKHRLLKNRPADFFADIFLVSLCAWLATCGFILYYFGIFSPITVVANIFTVPLATLLTLSGLTVITMHFLFPCLAGIFASTCELLTFLLLKINIFLIHLPHAYLRS